MKISKLNGLAALVVMTTAALSNTAHAAAGSGDVLLGFRATGGTGASTNLVVNLGQASQFTAPSDVASVTNVAADLAATYGPGWAARTDLFWSVAGATASFAGAAGDPAATTYASRLRPSTTVAADAWARDGITSQRFNTNQINTARSAFNGGTPALNASAVTMASANSNSWSAQQPGGALSGGISFQAWAPTIEGTPTQTLDFFRMTPTTSIGLVGDHVSTFVLGSNGALYVIPAAQVAAGLASAGTISISTPNVSATSGSTTAVVTVSRSGGLNAATVQFSTLAGTATSPADYTEITAQTVSFGFGQNSVNVPITLSGAPLFLTRTFTASISGPSSGATLGSVTTATIRIRSTVPDTTAPVLAITTPKANLIVKEPLTGGTLKFEGTLNGTTGDPSIQAVTLSFNGGAPVAATISSDKKKFSVLLTGVAAANAVLALGNNSVVATGTDIDANVGTSAAVPFFYEALRPLAISVAPALSGTVTISPALSSGNAAVGRTYTVSAKAATGFFFSSWSGKPTGSTAAASFTFAEGDTVVANFVATPFDSTVAGLYNGPAKASTPAAESETTAGLFTAKVTLNTGAFSAKLILDGVATPVAGVFNNVTKTFNSPAVPVVADGVVSSLTLDIPNSKITGTVTKMVASAATDVISVNAPLTFSKTTPATTQVGKYNVAFTVPAPVGTLAADRYPHGNGYGVLTIAADGKGKLAGYLADGQAYSAAAVLCKDNTFPVYSSFKGGAVGALAGLVTIDTAPADTDVTGTGLKWYLSPLFPGASRQYYPLGYETAGLTVDAVGALTSTSTKTALGLTSAPHLLLADGPFTTAVDKTLAVSGTSYASSDKLSKISFSTSFVMTGEYKTSSMAIKHVIRGIIVGKGGSAEAYGFALSPLPVVVDGLGQGGLVTVVP